MFDGTMPRILGKANFKIKAMTHSFDTDEEQAAKLGGNVFGYDWDVKTDTMAVKFPVNLSAKKRSVRTEPNLTIADLDKLRNMHLCKNNLLGLSTDTLTLLG